MKRRGLLYGTHPVELALRSAGKVSVVYGTGQGLARLDPRLLRHVDVVEVERRFLDRLTGGAVHQGLVAVTGGVRYLDESGLEELVETGLEAGEPLLLVALDRVTDPRNLGAVLRSVHELGGHGVIVPRRRSAGVTAAARKAAAGAAEFVPVARVANLARALEVLGRYGIRAVGAVGDGGRPPEEVDLAGHVVLVLGAEGAGLRPGVLARCVERVTIPTVGQVGSLNVSVAAGILLAEAGRQRRAKG